MEQIIINQNENQNIRINSNEPQTISISNIELQNLNVTQTKNQKLNIKENENQYVLVKENGSVIGITDVLVNGISVVSNNIAYVIVPTKTSQLENDNHFITREQDPTIPSYVKEISLADINNWNNKQNQLISGSTIKTVNNNSLLGSGNIEITGNVYSAGTGINIQNNIISNEVTSYNDLEDLPTIPTKVSDLNNDENFVPAADLSEVAFTGSYASLSNIPTIPENTSDLVNDSGFITKNVNDLTYYPLSSSLATVATSGNYNDLSNTPTIPTVNDGILTIQKNGTNIDTFSANSSTNKTVNVTVPTAVSELTNDSGYITNNYEVYSETETRIGTWITGKPLYRKVFVFDLTSTPYTFSSYSINLSNIGIIYINGNSFIKSSGNNYYQVNIGRYQNNTFAYNNEYSWFRISSSSVNYAIGDTLASGKCYLIVEYTKTTD